jgi:hypothetical protein
MKTFRPKRDFVESIPVGEHLRLLLLEVGGLLLHLVLDGVLPAVVLGLAARLEMYLVDVPVVQVVAKDGHKQGCQILLGAKFSKT